VSESVPHKWRKQAVATATDGERELIELKRRLREVEIERDILKKAALIFGRGSARAISSLTRNERFIRSMSSAGRCESLVQHITVGALIGVIP
jgi:transposase-like protein